MLFFDDDGIPVRYERQPAPAVRQRTPARPRPRAQNPPRVAPNPIRRRREVDFVQVRHFGQRRRRRCQRQQPVNVPRVRNVRVVLNRLTSRDIWRINAALGT